MKALLQYFAGDYMYLEDREFKTIKNLEGMLQSFAAEKSIEELIEIKDDVVNEGPHHR
ncbi:MAG: hypothetical protein ABI945_05935 [Nitrospirales bacterium]